MSGFITTMFVSSPSSIPFPAKPKPISPVSTFVQSQSCMNLRMDLLDYQEQGIAGGIWIQDLGLRDEKGILTGLALPKDTYKSPLQRLGEALRLPQSGNALTRALAEDHRPDARGRRPPKQPVKQPERQDCPMRPPADCSYNLLPDCNNAATSNDPTRTSALEPGQQHRAQNSRNNNHGAPRPLPHPPRNNGYFANPDLLSSLFSNPRTRAPFKPQKSNRGTSSWQLKQYAEATLGSGSLRKAVKLPEGEDKDEWLAVNIVDFYNQINLLYGSITEFCSPQSCPEMKATDEFEYLWQDSENYKRPTKMPAPEYIEHLMAWVQSNVDNEQMFPSRIGVPFPKTFPSLIRNMFKRLYRVYAHIYCHHYPVIIELGLEPHLNTSFKHYVLFIDEHGLANGSKDFWGPLGDLVESMLRSD
ncbi:Mitotic exit network component [Didymella pomorum]|uniref:Mitotic exit network component n=1 Tax=Didymella pomorum TaxID=749634 RepID=A0A9W8ZDG2_9PLEO|nr:Mitotic exit network component [Didymella pomorum]